RAPLLATPIINFKTFTDQTLRGALTCPRWPASPAQRQLSDWYRCPVAMVMVMHSERCPVVITARASPAERQLSDWHRCSVAIVLRSERCPVVIPARASPAERQ